MSMIKEYDEIKYKIIEKLKLISEILENHNWETYDADDDNDDLCINLGVYGYWSDSHNIDDGQVEFVTMDDYLKVWFHQTVYYDEFEDVTIEALVPIHWFSEDDLNHKEVVDYFLKMQRLDNISTQHKYQREQFHSLCINDMLNNTLDMIGIDRKWFYDRIKEAHPSLEDYPNG